MKNPVLQDVQKHEILKSTFNKHTPSEWSSYHENHYERSATACYDAERIAEFTKKVIQDSDAITRKCQYESTQRLKERVHDILFWKCELERQVNDIISETSFLVKEKQRLENVLMESDIPYHIVVDNLNARENRRNIDKVSDQVEKELLLELKIIQSVQSILKRSIDQAELQIKLNNQAKEDLEKNWSNKLEAERLDSRAAHLNNACIDKQFYAGVAHFQENMVDMESWANEANRVITKAEIERKASENLRIIVGSIIVDASRDIRSQFDRVNEAFADNINKLLAAKMNLENHLKHVLNEIVLIEHNLTDLKQAIRALDDPLRVAQTRLHTREFRPDAELCKDPASLNLADEIKNITQSMDSLMNQYSIVENKLHDLQSVQINLEREIDLKKETIHIDQVRCLPKRSVYPSALKLQGY